MKRNIDENMSLFFMGTSKKFLISEILKGEISDLGGGAYFVRFPDDSANFLILKADYLELEEIRKTSIFSMLDFEGVSV